MRLLSLALVITAAAVAACSARPAGQAASADDASPSAASAGYAAPPALTAVARGTDGTRVRGSAPAGASVRLAAPDGWSAEARADRRGSWTATLPMAAEPRLYALSADAGGRTLRAEGALVALPAPGPPVLFARPGAAALPAPSRGGGPVIAAVDYDAGGAAAVAGSAAPNTRVQLAVDGQPSDAATTDAGGRFALAGPRTRPLSLGPHWFSVQSAQGVAGAQVTLSAPPPFAAMYRAAREGAGWRIDWRLPGGGVQTTLVLERPA